MSWPSFLSSKTATWPMYYFKAPLQINTSSNSSGAVLRTECWFWRYCMENMSKRFMSRNVSVHSNTSSLRAHVVWFLCGTDIWKTPTLPACSSSRWPDVQQYQQRLRLNISLRGSSSEIILWLWVILRSIELSFHSISQSTEKQKQNDKHGNRKIKKDWLLIFERHLSISINI